MKAFDHQGKVMTEYLQAHAGDNKRQDAFYSGYISAVKDLLNVNMDVVKENG